MGARGAAWGGGPPCLLPRPASFPSVPSSCFCWKKKKKKKSDHSSQHDLLPNPSGLFAGAPGSDEAGDKHLMTMCPHGTGGSGTAPRGGRWAGIPPILSVPRCSLSLRGRHEWAFKQPGFLTVPTPPPVLPELREIQREAQGDGGWGGGEDGAGGPQGWGPALTPLPSASLPAALTAPSVGRRCVDQALAPGSSFLGPWLPSSP